jgi:hypothetical protein
MAEPTQYSFDLKEVTIALIKQQGLHEGTWMVALEFNLGAGMVATSPGAVKPGAVIQVNRIQLVRQDNPDSAPDLTVDAREVNPAPDQSKSSRPRGAEPSVRS